MLSMAPPLPLAIMTRATAWLTMNAAFTLSVMMWS
jgi:hypothetical protein